MCIKFKTLNSEKEQHLSHRFVLTIKQIYVPLFLPISFLCYSPLWSEWVKVAQSCPTLCDPMDCNSPGQNAGVGGLSLLQGSSQPRDQTQVSHIAGGSVTSWGPREAHCMAVSMVLYSPLYGSLCVFTTVLQLSINIYFSTSFTPVWSEVNLPHFLSVSLSFLVDLVLVGAGSSGFKLIWTPVPLLLCLSFCSLLIVSFLFDFLNWKLNIWSWWKVILL